MIPASATWYLTRGSGAVSLILLTAATVLGVLEVRRWSTPGWPRFVLNALHRNLSLLALALIAVHVLTSVVDGFAPIGLLDAVVPFTGGYRPLWVGLGALAFDLLLAVLVTSLLRAPIGHRNWRLVHWLAYAAWPVAFVHELGSGSDVNSRWMLAISGACLLAVVVAAGTRAAAGWPANAAWRSGAVAALVGGPLLLAVWLPRGPLASGWARRSGTPARLLVARSSASELAPAAAGAGAVGAPAGLDGALALRASGSVRPLATSASGSAGIDIALDLSGAGARRLDIRIEGQPLAGGGISLTSSQVALGTAAQPSLYTGALTALQGGSLAARLSRAGRSLSLRADLSVDAGGSASGSVTTAPLAAATPSATERRPARSCPPRPRPREEA